MIVPGGRLGEHRVDNRFSWRYRDDYTTPPRTRGDANCKWLQDNALRQLSTLILPPFSECKANHASYYRTRTYEKPLHDYGK